METPDVWKEFSGNIITHSGAHHLLAIWELTNERGYARVTDIAKSLDITTGSASTNLKSLKGKGLVQEDENRFLSLSKEGSFLAEGILKRRTTLIKFFTEILNVSSEQAEIDACKTEHLLSQETATKMDEFIAKTSN